MAHGLGMTITTERVEPEEQATQPRATGCEELQGSLDSRPEAAQDLGVSFRGGTREASTNRTSDAAPRATFAASSPTAGTTTRKNRPEVAAASGSAIRAGAPEHAAGPRQFSGRPAIRNPSTMRAYSARKVGLLDQSALAHFSTVYPGINLRMLATASRASSLRPVHA